MKSIHLQITNFSIRVYENNKSYKNRDEFKFSVQGFLKPDNTAYLYCAKGKFDRETKQLIEKELDKIGVTQVAFERHGEEKKIKARSKHKVLSWLCSWGTESIEDYK